MVFPKTAPKKFNRKLLLLVVPFLLVATFITYSKFFGVWPRLHKEVNQFVIPEGFTAIAKLQEGAEACFISCVEPRLTLLLQTQLSGSEACQRIEEKVRARTANVWQADGYFYFPPELNCHFIGELPEVYHDAKLFAEVGSGSTLLLTQHPRVQLSGWIKQHKQEVNPEATYVSLSFSSGID